MATIENFIEEWHNGKPYIKAHTSGSTGKPKEILLAKSDMLASAKATNEFFNIKADSCLALPLSIDYIAGKMMVVRAIEAGCELIPLNVSNNIIIPDEIKKIDLLPVVPSQIDSLIQNKKYASKIKNLLIGGAAPSPCQCAGLSDAGYNWFISYGMTETCSHVALADSFGSKRVFCAMPGISFDTDEQNRLLIITPGFSFKRLQTNDVVELLSPKKFIWKGRADNVINSGGLKLHPEELENQFRKYLPGIVFYLTSGKSLKWGSELVMVVEGKEDSGYLLSVLEEAGIESKYLPKRVICYNKLPRTSSFKIIRQKF